MRGAIGARRPGRRIAAGRRARGPGYQLGETLAGSALNHFL
jgi:hypothetical protein